MIPKIGPRQYPITKPQVNNEEDSKAKQTSAQTQEDGENLQQSKGLAYAEENRNQTQLPTGEQTRSNLVQTTKTNTKEYTATEQEQEEYHKVTNHNGLCKTNTPLSQRSTKINIAQILKDFKNTAVAIATPDDLMEEVDGYIDLIKKQVSKDKPNVKLIQSNLKNAGGLLDKYISDTLNKDSKVVQNWVEAVFLQDVNYKYDDEEVNVDFLVNFPEKKEEEKPKEPQKLEETKPQVVEDKDKELKEKFIKAKKESSIEQFREALSLTDNAHDKEIKPKITFEMGKIYDKQDKLPEALICYQQTLENSKDNNLKFQTHYSMAKIYDDVNEFEPAIDHYFIAIGYAGEAENDEAQTTFLTKMANLFADKYDRKALEFYSEAETTAERVDKPNVKAFVSSNRATAYDKFNMPKDALKYYSDAIQNYSQTNSTEKIAINYKRAGELMSDYKKKDKAKSLLQKAMSYAIKLDDKEMMKEINKELIVNM
ncbi:hypothetical protein IJ818_06215 [bacterium]|nr:hypothetical protein [bacterium]